MNHNNNNLPPSGFNPSPFDGEDSKPTPSRQDLTEEQKKELADAFHNFITKVIDKHLNDPTSTSFELKNGPDGKPALKLKIQPNQKANLPKEKQVFSFFEAEMTKLNYQFVLGAVYDYFLQNNQLECLGNFVKSRDEFIAYHWENVFKAMLDNSSPDGGSEPITITL